MAICPQCGSKLIKVEYTSNSHLNEDQWNSMRAGDWYCTKCPDNERGVRAHAYFWDSEVELEIEGSNDPKQE